VTDRQPMVATRIQARSDNRTTMASRQGLVAPSLRNRREGWLAE
jgi:hypothetical protein